MKKNWFENEKSMSLVRCIAAVIMQLLRESAKAPFSSNGSVELARILITDPFPMTKLLFEATKGVNLTFKRAGSVFNLLLAPLELLTKYSLSFILKLSKNYEALEIHAQYRDISEEEQSPNASENEQQIDHEIENDEEEDEEEEEEEESNLRENESVESSAEEPPVLDHLVIESWNTEAFWADDLDEEEEEEFPRRNLEARPYDAILAERALLEQEVPQPYFNYRQTFRDYDENMSGSMPWLDLENDDIIQALLQRSRNQHRQELPAEPVFQRLFPESSDYLNRFAIQASELAHEEPLVEGVHSEDEQQGIPPELAPYSEPARDLQEDLPNDSSEEAVPEEQKSAVPEGIDPSFLEALPEDIRNEILAQYQRPPRSDVASEKFLLQS